jgi:hypothetical protein
MLTALFCFSYFLYGVSSFCLGLVLDYTPPTYASDIDGIIVRIIDTSTTPTLFVEMWCY